MSVARRIADDVLAGPSDRLIAEADPDFVRRMGGPIKFAAALGELRSKAGRQLSVDYERLFRLGNEITYDRVGSFDHLGHAWLEVTFSLGGAHVTGMRIDREAKKPSSFLSFVPQTQLRLPFGQPPSGTAWFVLWAGDKAADNYHARRETHFAIDFLPRPVPGSFAEKTVRGSPCWGVPILAAAAGVVVTAKDGMKDQPKLFAPNNAGGPGNYVVIDHGNGEFSLYGHMKQGTIRVRPGDKVASGDRLGSCGNSGASEIPHLHFQLQTNADINTADGLPPLFHDYFDPVRHVQTGSLQRGDYVLPGPNIVSRSKP